MELQDFLNLINHRITGGDKFEWECYGPNARTIDSFLSDDETSASVVFDTVNQVVYEATVIDELNDKPFRWINPDFKDAYYAEAKARDCNPNQAWDDVEYINLDMECDFFRKGESILAGEEYDDLVTIALDVPHDELFTIMMAAHRQDITLNEFMVNALENLIEELDTPEGLTKFQREYQAKNPPNYEI